MKVVLRNTFFRDQTKHSSGYLMESEKLASRFEAEVETAIATIAERPTSAGHPICISSKLGLQFRRRNLRSFPFFILYAIHEERIILARLCASRSDPLSWGEGV